jgi:uncharacterized protein
MAPYPVLDFAGHRFWALPDRALYWPQEQALIVADLHLEKASWYATHGQPLPPYDSQDNIDRLNRLARETNARAIWCLGDSFHDRDAQHRMPAMITEQLRALASTFNLVWVAGNHDGLIGEAWGGTVADALYVGGLVLRHQSVATEGRPEISGHFHPKLRIHVRGRSIARPCFAGDERRLILPAFGSLTGGLDVQSPIIAENFFGNYFALVVSDRRLLRFLVPNDKPDTATAKRVNAPS